MFIQSHIKPHQNISLSVGCFLAVNILAGLVVRLFWPRQKLVPVTKVSDIKPQFFPPFNVLSTSFPTNSCFLVPFFGTFFGGGTGWDQKKKWCFQKNDAKFSQCFFGTPGVVVWIPCLCKSMGLRGWEFCGRFLKGWYNRRLWGKSDQFSSKHPQVCMRGT